MENQKLLYKLIEIKNNCECLKQLSDMNLIEFKSDDDKTFLPLILKSLDGLIIEVKEK